MKKLPIGIQSFVNLRREDYLYVDKTEQIYRLISEGRYYFLSRPRRFGKSLLVSTLEEIFRGNRDLFEGLYIHDRIDWQEHPVIKIDWSAIKHTTPEEMEAGLQSYLDSIAASYQVKLTSPYAPNRFDELIGLLHAVTGKQAVVLIDEYDMPILDVLTRPESVNPVRDYLRSFYRVLKAADEHLRFVFLTGVSKFSKVSIFSGLNNLTDITLSYKYATICGYTQAELEVSFKDHIVDFAGYRNMSNHEALATIRDWYNGYSWDGSTSVYNPFSTLLLFSEKRFKNYWFATGTPTFLIDRIRQRNEVEAVLEPAIVPETNFDSSEPDRLDTRQLMFQTGYLTVKKVTDNMFDETQDYTLGIPNKEVRDSLLSHLFAGYACCSPAEAEPARDRMKRQLVEGNQEGFTRSMREIFAHVPDGRR